MSGSNDEIVGDTAAYDSKDIARAARLLRAGKLCAVPTETVYGLAADSSNAKAVAEIYRTKGRPDFNPLILHVLDLYAAKLIGQFCPLSEKLASAFWPGPLTLVIPKVKNCPVTPAVTAGLETVALRSPAHPMMRALLEATGLALAAPSANRSGGISPTSPLHVAESLGNKAPFILDGGVASQGIESTIVKIEANQCYILRPGPITAEMIENIIDHPVTKLASVSKITAPGQMVSHYAPSKPLRLNASSPAPDEFHIGFGNIDGDLNLSPSGDLAEAASNLFAYLHRADASQQRKLAVAPVRDDGIGVAINDRLKRASA